MSRIGTFADDDIYGWATKSPDLGGAIANFSQAVYTKNRLPMRTREIARAVIAHDNECTVCMNTRDADGPAEGVDEALYEHALQWRTWEGFSEQERLAAEFAHRFGTEHTKLREDEDFGDAPASTSPRNCWLTSRSPVHSGSAWAGCCGPSISARLAS